MTPKKQLIDRARQDGSIDRMNRLLSGSHLLLCQANNLLEEASDLMSAHGLLLGRLKQLHNLYTRAADQYFREFATMVGTERQKMDMFRDMDGLDDLFRRWAKLPRGWTPKNPDSSEQPPSECHLHGV